MDGAKFSQSRRGPRSKRSLRVVEDEVCVTRKAYEGADKCVYPGMEGVMKASTAMLLIQDVLITETVTVEVEEGGLKGGGAAILMFVRESVNVVIENCRI